MTHVTLISIVYIVVGCVVLAWAAERFIVGASSLARNFGVSPLIIGITVVGFATSFPEMVVSAIAAWHGLPQMAVGNAVGSNIANIGLVLGIVAMVKPLAVHSKVLQREMPIQFAVMLAVWWLLRDLNLNRLDGVILLTGLCLMIAWMFYNSLSVTNEKDPLLTEIEAETPKDIMPTGRSIFWLLAGLVLLLLSSRYLVVGATHIARTLGVSEFVIGLTIVAIGTSLPELAASIVAAMRGESDIALGNIVGSNMFNMLGVMAMPALIHPTKLAEVVISQDFPIMVAFTVALFVMAFGLRKDGIINRFEGAMLFAGYIAYIAYLY